MRIRFYYYLDTIQLAALSLFRKKYAEIHYFNISPFAKALLGLSGLNKHIRQFDFDLSEIQNEDGSLCWPKIYGDDLMKICNIIEKRFLNKDAFIDGIGRIFDKSKIMMFYQKLINKDMEERVVSMSAIAQYSRNINKGPTSSMEFVMPDELFFSVLKEFAAQEYNIILRSFFTYKRIAGYLALLFRNLYQLLADCIRSLRLTVKNNTAPAAAHLYTLKGFVFNSIERCDFPWLLSSNIPGENILIYFEREDVPVIDKMVNEARQRKINLFAMSKGASASKEVPVYQPTINVAKTILTLLSRVVAVLCGRSFNLRTNSLAYFPELLRFIKVYAKAYDFYKTYGIKINVNTMDINPYFIARYLAMKDVGGVSIIYQISNWPITNIELVGSCADIVFMFGPSCYPNFIKSGSRAEHILISGYISDYAFGNMRERSRHMRNKLQNNGARFIISYFDENSTSGRMTFISDTRNSYIYKRLLEWTLSDPEIGLICSPKAPKRTLKNLPEINGLLRKAKETGRCLFMEGEYLTSNYPSQVAQASDVAITLLAGGTTALECFLAGARVVYLDLEKLYSYPEYNTGKGTLVFDNFDDLYNAIQKYRKNPAGMPGFGDISEYTKDKDIFKDGNAARRISQYIDWLFEAFKNGENRSEAIKYANVNYSKAWGQGSVKLPAGDMQMPKIEQTCPIL